MTAVISTIVGLLVALFAFERIPKKFTPSLLSRIILSCIPGYLALVSTYAVIVAILVLLGWFEPRIKIDNPIFALVVGGSLPLLALAIGYAASIGIAKGISWFERNSQDDKEDR